MSYKNSHIWKEFAQQYDHNIANKFESRIYRIENQILLDNLQHFLKNKYPAIMDFACGTGRITALLASHYHHIVWYDISEDMLQVAKTKYPQLTFQKKDITKDISQDILKFDCITSFRFFLNAEYQLKKDILEHFRKYLKKDGIVIFNIHMNTFSPAFILTRLKYILWLTKIKQNGMSYREVKDLLKDTGFKILKANWYSFLLGNPLLTFLPFALLRYIDSLLAEVEFLKFFSKDILYVCKISDENK